MSQFLQQPSSNNSSTTASLNPLNTKFQPTFDYIFNLMTAWTSSYDPQDPKNQFIQFYSQKKQSNNIKSQEITKQRQKSPYSSKDKSIQRSKDRGDPRLSSFSKNQQIMMEEERNKIKIATEKDIQNALTSFEKMISYISSVSHNMSNYIFGNNASFLSNIYQCYLIIFVNSQNYLQSKSELIFKAFYSMIKIGNSNSMNQFENNEENQIFKKMITLIESILEFCSIGDGIIDKQKNYSDNVINNLRFLFSSNNPLNKNETSHSTVFNIKNKILKLVLKAIEKQWNQQIVVVFFNFYLNKVQQYQLNSPQLSNLNKQTLISNLSELSQIITNRFKSYTTQIINKIIKNIKQNNSMSRQKIVVVNYYLLIQMKSNPYFIMTIIKQNGFQFPTANLQKINFFNKSLSQNQKIQKIKVLQVRLIKKFYECFIKLFEGQDKLYINFQKLQLIYPIKNAKNNDQVWSNLLLQFFLTSFQKQTQLESYSQISNKIKLNKGKQILSWIKAYCLNQNINYNKNQYKNILKGIQISALIYISPLSKIFYSSLTKHKIIYQLKEIILKSLQCQQQKQKLKLIVQDTLQIITYQPIIQVIETNQKLQKIYQFLNQNCDQYINNQTNHQTSKLKMDIQQQSIQKFPSVSKLNKSQLFEVCNLLLQICKKYTNQFNQENHLTIPQQKFPILSYQLFNMLNITPKNQIPRPIPQKLSIQPKILSKALKILQNLIQQYSFQEISPIVKKCLSIHYDKINQFTLKQNYNCNNGLFVKILVLVGIKVKTLAQILLRKSQNKLLQFNINQKSSNQKTDLEWVFPKLQKNVLLEYCRLLSSKDKYKFRLQIFEKNLINYQFLINENPGKLAF